MNIDRIREFNRFYTHKIGLITNRFLDSAYSLVQARLLFELNRSGPSHAADLARKFRLSPDYMSKIMSNFEARGLITRSPSPTDARKQILAPTPAARAVYSELQKKSNTRIEKMVDGLNPEEIEDLVQAMDTIENILEPRAKKSNLITLRSHRPGDIGTVIHRHGVLYSREYGFTHAFDAYVAQGMAGFIEGITPREHLWIAEIQGRFAGSIAIVRRDDETAQLRWLIVEPSERTNGIGRQLVAEAVRFSKEKGYRAITLWTIDFLHAARHLYDAAGFHVVKTKDSQVWGKTLTEECWRLDLDCKDV